MLQLTNSNGRPQTVAEWVEGMRQEDRIALHAALAPFVKESSTGPVSLEKIRSDFTRLSKADCMEFIKGIHHGVAVAEAIAADEELDVAINADLARRRGAKAVDDAWAASIADAKARSERAAKEVA